MMARRWRRRARGTSLSSVVGQNQARRALGIWVSMV
jgi:DNA helicase TIP49 (TBP-interacting protein)